MEYLYEKLEAYGKSDYYGFHMPGHKRNSDVTRANLPYGIDITEIEGFDNLHHAEEIIREAEVRAASMYHAEETHYLINGSTAGILSAVMGCTKKGLSKTRKYFPFASLMPAFIVEPCPPFSLSISLTVSG